MLPTLSKLEYTKVVVAGYTDNVPISAKLKAGAGLDISGNGAQCHEVTLVQGFARVTVKGGGNSVAAGVLTGDFLLRLPLDDFWLSVHLAPYFFAGLGGIFIGNGGEGHSVSQTFTVTNAAGESRDVTFTGRRVNSLRKTRRSDTRPLRRWTRISVHSPYRDFWRKLLMSSRICQTTTLYRLTLVSDSPSK